MDQRLTALANVAASCTVETGDGRQVALSESDETIKSVLAF